MTSILVIMPTLFILSGHPITMCFTMIATILISSLQIWQKFNSFMTIYFVIMLYVGGMMILFIYISAIIPNAISPTNKMLAIPILMIIPAIFMSNSPNCHMNKNMNMGHSTNQETTLILTSIMIVTLMMSVSMVLNPLTPMKSTK